MAEVAAMPDVMEQGPEAVLVIHIGGTYGDVPAGWVETWEKPPAREPFSTSSRLAAGPELFGRRSGFG